MKTSKRASGILLHPTSLPGPYGIGDIGPQAYRWVDFLAETGTHLWQVLPLGPTGYGDSPYQCFSAFAGNPYLISFEALAVDGLCDRDILNEIPEFEPDRVDFGRLIPWKVEVLDRVYERFAIGNHQELKAGLEAFRSKHSEWLDDYTLFMALKDIHNGKPWWEWDPGLRTREPAAIQEAREKLAPAIGRHEFLQFIFFSQWGGLRTYAAACEVKLIGDIPIFVAQDSADVWANPELFYLDSEGRPTVVAGVPPDYFSLTGQLWGNPLYRWEAHAVDGYRWWLARLRSVLDLVDIVRLDHFRGFAAAWEVPAGEETAERGRWAPGPGEEFFQVVMDNLGSLPVIAEDLGEITPDVEAMREQFALPGMKVLVFAFDSGPKNPFLPHHHTPDSVVYTGTHDNDTIVGWYRRAETEERDYYRRYLNTSGDAPNWELIRAAWASVGVYALAPLQDFLGLGNEARMNYPGRPSGNWQWRMTPDALTSELSGKLAELNITYGRNDWKTEDGD